MISVNRFYVQWVFSTTTLWTSLFQTAGMGMSGYFLLLPCFIEISVFNANSADPDQMQHSAVSDWVSTVCQLPSNGFQD